MFLNLIGISHFKFPFTRLRLPSRYSNLAILGQLNTHAKSLVAAAETNSVSLAQATETWLDGLALADHDYSDAVAAADHAWLYTDADAQRTRDRALADAGETLSDALALAAKNYKNSLTAAWAGWSSAESTATGNLATALDTATVTWTAAIGTADSQLETDRSAARSTFVSSLGSASSTAGAQIGTAGKDWIADVAQAVADFTGSEVHAAATFAGGEITARQSWLTSVADERAAAIDTWRTAEGTAWADYVAAEASAWSDWVASVSTAEATFVNATATPEAGMRQTVAGAEAGFAADLADAWENLASASAGAWAAFYNDMATHTATYLQAAADSTGVFLNAEAAASGMRIADMMSALNAFQADALAAETLFTQQEADAAQTEAEALADADTTLGYAVADAVRDYGQDIADAAQVLENALADAEKTRVESDADADRAWAETAWPAETAFLGAVADADLTATAAIETATGTYRAAVAQVDYEAQLAVAPAIAQHAADVAAAEANTRWRSPGSKIDREIAADRGRSRRTDELNIEVDGGRGHGQPIELGSQSWAAWFYSGDFIEDIGDGIWDFGAGVIDAVARAHQRHPRILRLDLGSRQTSWAYTTAAPSAAWPCRSCIGFISGGACAAAALATFGGSTRWRCRHRAVRRLSALSARHTQFGWTAWTSCPPQPGAWARPAGRGQMGLLRGGDGGAGRRCPPRGRQLRRRRIGPQLVYRPLCRGVRRRREQRRKSGRQGREEETEGSRRFLRAPPRLRAARCRGRARLAAGRRKWTTTSTWPWPPGTALTTAALSRRPTTTGRRPGRRSQCVRADSSPQPRGVTPRPRDDVHQPSDQQWGVATMPKTETAVAMADRPAKRRRSVIRGVLTAFFLLLAGYFGLCAALGPDGWLTENIVTRPIEQVQLGQRTPGRNPELGQVDQDAPEPDPETWRYVRLEMRKADTPPLHIELLRPIEWLAAKGAEPGGTIYLELPEMGAVGDALVHEIDRCPPIQPGEGNVVTGRFVHEHHGTITRVRLAGQLEAHRRHPQPPLLERRPPDVHRCGRSRRRRASPHERRHRPSRHRRDRPPPRQPLQHRNPPRARLPGDSRRRAGA